MKKYTLIIICLSTLVYAQEKPDSIRSDLTKNVQPIEFPKIDISAGFGFLWLIQVNLTLSPYKHIYVQPRLSSSGLMHEIGFVVGYQTRVNLSSLFRIGIGFSKGRKEVIDPGGRTASDLDKWETHYFRIGFLTNSKFGSLINPNLNIIRGDHNTIFSVNFAFAWVII